MDVTKKIPNLPDMRPCDDKLNENWCFPPKPISSATKVTSIEHLKQRAFTRPPLLKPACFQMNHKKVFPSVSWAWTIYESRLDNANKTKVSALLLPSDSASAVRFLKRFSNFDLRFRSLWLAECEVHSCSPRWCTCVSGKQRFSVLRTTEFEKDRFSFWKIVFRVTFTFCSTDSWFFADRGSFSWASWAKRRTLIGRLSFHSAFLALRWW